VGVAPRPCLAPSLRAEQNDRLRIEAPDNPPNGAADLAVKRSVVGISGHNTLLLTRRGGRCTPRRRGGSERMPLRLSNRLSPALFLLASAVARARADLRPIDATPAAVRPS